MYINNKWATCSGKVLDLDLPYYKGMTLMTWQTVAVVGDVAHDDVVVGSASGNG